MLFQELLDEINQKEEMVLKLRGRCDQLSGPSVRTAEPSQCTEMQGLREDWELLHRDTQELLDLRQDVLTQCRGFRGEMSRCNNQLDDLSRQIDRTKHGQSDVGDKLQTFKVCV